MKTLGQIAYDERDSWFDKNRSDTVDEAWGKVAAAVILAYERRKPCRECVNRHEQANHGGCVCDDCRWAYKSKFKRRERGGWK